MNPVVMKRGRSPIILAQPHGGTYLPDDIFNKLNDCGKGLDDTDWHINKLYDGLNEEMTVVQATFHRYVIDANRDPEGQSLYPDRNTTGLCPLTNFDGAPIWLDGKQPTPADTEHRCKLFHTPYHDALGAEIERVKSKYGFAILYDCHSIRSEIPYLFEGLLPIFNTGTNNGISCSAAIEKAVTSHCETSKVFDHVLNGRFKGGWTTRHYGQPANNVHAIQMETSQRAYMEEEPPWIYREDKASQIRPILIEIFRSLDDVASSINPHS